MQGSGTQTDPYIISTPSDLNSIRNHLSSYFELANDIDMSTWGNWSIVLNFNGVIDGKGHVIKNLTNVGSVNSEASACAFLSSSTTTSFTIKNLGLKDIYFNNTNSSYRAGAFTNYSYNATIENCFATGEIITNGQAGGIAACVRSNSIIKDSWSNVKITGTLIAGICPLNLDSTIIQNTYSIGKLNGTTNEGIAHYTSASSVNNFYDTQSTGTTTSVIGIGKTTADMKQQTTYTGWDFTNTWGINGDYPYLQVFGVPLPSAKIGSAEVNSFSSHMFSNIVKYVKVTKNNESTLKPIVAETSRRAQTKRNALAYTLPFDSSIENSNRTVRSSIEYATAFINPISAIVERHSKTVHNLFAYLKPIEADTSVLIPINDMVINAYLSVIESPSMGLYNENMNELSILENPSSCEVI